jgi:hypothetical protein
MPSGNPDLRCLSSTHELLPRGFARNLESCKSCESLLKPFLRRMAFDFFVIYFHFRIFRLILRSEPAERSSILSLVFSPASADKLRDTPHVDDAPHHGKLEWTGMPFSDGLSFFIFKLLNEVDQGCQIFLCTLHIRQNREKMYQITAIIIKCTQNVLNCRKIFQMTRI